MRYLSVLSLILVLILAFMQFQQGRELSAMEQQLSELTQAKAQQDAQLQAAIAEIAFLRNKARELEQNSLQGMADKANGALFKGLENLLDSVGNELKKAQQNLQQRQQDNSAPAGANSNKNT